jgi:hypothetical protein
MQDLLAAGGLPPWRGVQPVGVIAGSAGFGFGRLLIRLERPNDGTVTVAETRLDGIADHVVVAAAHTALLFSRAAAAATLSFLLEGRFSRPA